MTPLSDEAFDENAKASYDTNLRAAGRKWEALNELIADARWHRAELAKVKAENERLRKALDWYSEKAVALASEKAKSPDYALAVVTELTLDAGKRARAALATKQVNDVPSS